MPRDRRLCRLASRLVPGVVCFVLLALPPAQAQGQLRPLPEALAGASPEVLARLRVDPFSYFRFINRVWTARVCEAFADMRDLPIVRLHGDAHVEQFAFTNDAWGLDDFDESARGPAVIDIVRFLGSIDLATRQLGWTRDRDALWDRFLEGYRRGLAEPAYRPAEPAIVLRLRNDSPVTRGAYLAWGESLMQPLDEARLKALIGGMQAFERF